MELKKLLRKFPEFTFFGEDMQDDEHCVWAYDLQTCTYMQFIHTGDGRYKPEIIDRLSKTEIDERFRNDARNLRPLK